MFTWVCQRCGKEVDIAEVECPHCAVETSGTELGSAHGAARGQVDEEYRPTPDQSAQRLPPVKRAEPGESTVPRPQPPPHALAVKPLHMGLFLLAVLLSLTVAVYLARPELFSFEGVSLPKLPQAELSPLQQGPIEVAGIRAWRDTEAKLKVRAVMINHSQGPQPDRRWRVTLRDPAAETEAPATATFEVEFEEPLLALESREFETDLSAPEGLTALPEWNRIQIQLEPIEPAPQ